MEYENRQTTLIFHNKKHSILSRIVQTIQNMLNKIIKTGLIEALFEDNLDENMTWTSVCHYQKISCTFVYAEKHFQIPTSFQDDKAHLKKTDRQTENFSKNSCRTIRKRISHPTFGLISTICLVYFAYLFKRCRLTISNAR